MNNHFLKKIAFFSLFVFTVFSISAQKSEVNATNYTAYQHAKKLYNNKTYLLAQKTFKKTTFDDTNPTTLRADAAYYYAMCAIKLNQADAEKIVFDFVKNHPNSNKKEDIFFNVGNYYFKNRNPKSAIKWYSKVNIKTLSKTNQQELNFKMGYVMLLAHKLDAAKKRFSLLINDNRYATKANYYYGYIAYKQEDYKIAEKYFSKIADEPSYKDEIAYYLLNINFKEGKFEKCISIGNKLLQNRKQKQHSDISKIIGESYFNLKKYKDALPYLKKYKGNKGRLTNTDYYQLGYAYYKQNDFENAIKNFNKIIGSRNTISQNAYYHLAECYLYLEKKSEALNAFKSASEMSFDTKIKEDAFLNYAKLSYEMGNPYKSVAQVLQEFLTKYPNSTSYKEINQLVVTSYLHQQDYQGALDYLARKNSVENTNLAKDVSYYRGIQLFNQNKLNEAYPYFVVASKSSDNITRVSAMYWKAETDFRLSKFQKSLKGFNTFKRTYGASNVKEYNNIDYNIAYNHFKLKNYTKAANSFRLFISKAKKGNTLIDDANIRLADCYFVTKNYLSAINAYDKVIENSGNGSDYATYQKAISYGFLGNNSSKIKNLNNLIRKYKLTSLQDDALFQLANTFVSVKNNKKADETYNLLIKNHSKSSYIPKALLRQGLVHYNDNENMKALHKFRKIVSSYPNSNEAKEAVNNAKNVYVDLGQVDVYANWVKNISFVNVTNADLDNTTYESAENKFLENNTTKAIEGFKKYLETFPNGLNSLKANFYLAQSLSKANKQDEAEPYYKFVIDQSQSEFNEEALNKLSQIYLERNNWKSAITLLAQLESIADYPQNILFAQSNLMKGYYEGNLFEKAVEYAEKVLQKKNLNENVKSDAKTIIARSSFKTGNFQKAEKFYSEVEQNADGELKAEALYYKAYFKNQNKRYKESNSVVQKLIADYSSYKYWGVKSYIIMAKNHYELKDAYQATYILENIIKNFTQFDDIIIEAKKELALITSNEAKTNESVVPNKN